MMMKKIIDKVEPFNQFALRDCFYSMLFPAIKGLDGSAEALAIATNNDTVFSYKRGRFIQNNRRPNREEIDRLILEQNIDLISHDNYEEDIVAYIQNCIDNEQLVIVSLVDSLAFDPSTGEETCGHVGYGHWVLFYGYDDQCEEFSVIDHFHLESPIYYELRMKYDELSRSYTEHNKQYGSRMKIISRSGERVNEAILKEKYCYDWFHERKDETNNAVIEYLDYLYDFFTNERFSKVKMLWYFVAEDIVRLNLYYLKQKYIINALGNNKELQKQIDHQMKYIYELKKIIYGMRTIKTEEDYEQFKSKIGFIDDFRKNGIEVETRLDQIKIPMS